LFDDELKRVIIHGVLHFMGFNDKTDDEKSLIRKKEDSALEMFHVKQ
jgi:ssRNA-specific RNase YbeY (16S rRNA maturation enzyme)